MKKVFVLLFFCLQFFSLKAANISVSIASFAFGSISNTLNVGDVITWTNNDASTHTVTSTSVPSGAATFNSGNLTNGGTFQYTVQIAGSYTYHCAIHTSMTGSFTVAGATPVMKPTLVLNGVYPNPAIDYVHIESPKTIASVNVYSETGAFIKTVTFSSDKIDLSVSELEKGVYLIRIESTDGLIETRKIIKN